MGGVQIGKGTHREGYTQMGAEGGVHTGRGACIRVQREGCTQGGV